jgi:DNA repair protein SbcD/Mre11
MRFLAIADLHLGYEQYSSPERFNDFSRAFLWLMHYANAAEVEFIVVGGDTFHKRTVDPLAMMVAVEGFSIPKCPIYAIEGNHEKAYFVNDRSWVDYLEASGAFWLLDGNCADAPDRRVCGLKYAGAQTDAKVEALCEELQPFGEPAILVLHAGVEGVIAHAGGVKLETLERFSDRFSLVCLGHVHKPFILNDWILNPGSPENGSSDEVLWPYRGALMVEQGEWGNFEYRYVVPPRRPFHRFDINVTGLLDPSHIYDAVSDSLKSHAPDPACIVDFSVTGEVPFGRADIDTRHIQNQIAEAWDPLVVHVRNLAVPSGFSLSIDDGHSRADVEHQVLEHIVMRDSRYRDETERWVRAAMTTKQIALTAHAEDVLAYAEGLDVH